MSSAGGGKQQAQFRSTKDRLGAPTFAEVSGSLQVTEALKLRELGPHEGLSCQKGWGGHCCWPAEVQQGHRAVSVTDRRTNHTVAQL